MHALAPLSAGGVDASGDASLTFGSPEASAGSASDAGSAAEIAGSPGGSERPVPPETPPRERSFCSGEREIDGAAGLHAVSTAITASERTDASLTFRKRPVLSRHSLARVEIYHEAPLRPASIAPSFHPIGVLPCRKSALKARPSPGSRPQNPHLVRCCHNKATAPALALRSAKPTDKKIGEP